MRDVAPIQTEVTEIWSGIWRQQSELVERNGGLLERSQSKLNGFGYKLYTIERDMEAVSASRGGFSKKRRARYFEGGRSSNNGNES